MILKFFHVTPAPRRRWPILSVPVLLYTDEKEKQIFLIYKEIQNGAASKSYMTNGLAHFLIYSIRTPFLVYDFATAPP